MNDNDPKYYRYLILFNEDVQDADPILHISDMNKLKAMNEGRMHLFDDALNAILPAAEYCFHMPRTELDTYDTDTEVLDKAYDVPQDIFIMPDSRFPSVDIGSSFTCIIYSESCREEVKQKARNSSCELGAVSIEELSQSLLVEQWNKLFENRNFRNETKLEDIDKQYLLTEEKQMALPLLFTARQYGKADEVYGKVFNSLDIFETCAKLLWNQTVHHNALMHCKDFEGEEQERFRKLYAEGLEEAEKKSKINIVITMPGVPQNQINYGGLEKILPENEKKVIKLLGIHRAIAKGALLIELPPVGKELFEKLNELEINCQHKTNNKYVHKALRNIGKMLESKFTQEQLWAVNRAQHITIFSDFPLGLAIVGKADASLQCYKEISYRPLSPLTRCFQDEMVKHSQIYHGHQCKIAFAECILNDEQNCGIRKCSEGLVNSLQRLSKDNPRMQVVYRETLTVSDLKQFLLENSDADILHISAHGHYDRRTNMAGLMIGNEFWMANDNNYRVPPVVILSACHVSPRGSGTVNVADMFKRVGAEAVLSTFIPIDARRNMILLNRLYTYISEAQKGSNQYKTLSEAWGGVVATNAIHEMTAESPKFFQWLWGNNSNGETRMMDFAMHRSVKRLHGPTIYGDTIEVIKEMLREEGMEGKFDDVLSQGNYFPESFFYQWIGFPENVFLYNEVFAETI